MRKIKLSLIVLSVIFIGCADSPAYDPFDPNVNPFIGEWRRTLFNPDWGTYFETYVFTENQFTITNTLGREESGVYEFSRDRLIFHTETRSWEFQYELIGQTRILLSAIDGTPGSARFSITRQQYHDLGLELWAIREKRNAFPVNEEELASIQGVWRIPGPWRVTYTFSGTDFTLTRHRRAPFPEFISGTLKIDNNHLLLMVDNELFGFYLYEFQPNNVLFLHEIFGHRDSHWGGFVRR